PGWRGCGAPAPCIWAVCGSISLDPCDRGSWPPLPRPWSRLPARRSGKLDPWSGMLPCFAGSRRRRPPTSQSSSRSCTRCRPGSPASSRTGLAATSACRTPISELGINLSHPGRDLLLAIPCGLLGFGVAAGFAEYLSRRAGHWFVPDRTDLALQSFYYIVLNAPIEEWFFRGFLQGELVR